MEKALSIVNQLGTILCVCVWNFSKEVKPVPALLQQRTSMYLFKYDFVDIPRGYCHCFLCC